MAREAWTAPESTIASSCASPRRSTPCEPFQRSRDRPGVHRCRQAELHRLLRRARAALPGRGVVLVDNTLWSGGVTDPAGDDENTVAIRAFNDHVTADDRVESWILPVSDGLTPIRKR